MESCCSLFSIESYRQIEARLLLHTIWEEGGGGGWLFMDAGKLDGISHVIYSDQLNSGLDSVTLHCSIL